MPRHCQVRKVPAKIHGHFVAPTRNNRADAVLLAIDAGWHKAGVRQVNFVARTHNPTPNSRATASRGKERR